MSRSSSAYKITGFEYLAVESLEPHPNAAMPIDEDDSRIINQSLSKNGVLTPLLVSEDADDEGRRWVYDGASRLAQAKAAGLTQVPCNLVAGLDPDRIATECLTAGRKRTTGQRALLFFLNNRVETREMFDFIQEYPNGGQPSERSVSSETLLSAKEISKQLGVCREDIIQARDLAFCVMFKQEYRLIPKGCYFRDLDLSTGEHKAYYARLVEVRDAVLAGSMGIRNWKASFAGMNATKEKVKAPTKHTEIIVRSFHALKNNLAHWGGLSSYALEDIRSVTVEVFENFPSDLDDDLVEGLSRMPEQRRKKLLAAIKKAV